MTRIRHRHATVAAAFALFFAAVPSIAAEPSPPLVVTSVPPVHSLVASVMQGVGEPVLLIPGTASPHSFSLRPSDARRLAGANLVVWVGPALETSLRKPIEALAGKAHLITLSETPGIALLPVREGGAWGEHHDGETEHEHDDTNPARDEHAQGERDHDHDAATHERHDDHEIDAHVWLSTANARVIVETVAAELIEHDPANAAAYTANRDATLQRLDALTTRLRASLARVSQQPFVVLHDGYQYFEKQFGLNGVGAIYVSPDIDPGAHRLVELRDRVAELGARCIFAEPQLNAALVRIVAEGTGARTGTLDPVGANLPPGPTLYGRLMEDLAAGFNGCLAAEG
jgi:zinc transport system substrate-binding protein